MPSISKAANLNQTYTCHSVRASCITILGQAGIVPGNICKITKHKNEASLKHYFTELSTDQKQECTSILSGALGEPPAVTEPQSMEIVSVPQPSNGVITEQMPDGSLSVTLPSASQYAPVSCTSNSATTDMKYLQNLLPNCKFDSCTIHINTSNPQWNFFYYKITMFIIIIISYISTQWQTFIIIKNWKSTGEI